MKPYHWILALLALLLILLTTLLTLRSHRETDAGPRVEYKGRMFPLKDLMMPTPMHVVAQDNSEYEALPVGGIISACNIKLAQVQKLTFLSSDGGKSVISGSEITRAYLLSESAGEWRLIVPTDDFKQRWLKHVVRIVAE